MLIGRLRIRVAEDIVIHSNHQYHRSCTVVSGDNLLSFTIVIGLRAATKSTHQVVGVSSRHTSRQQMMTWVGRITFNLGD